VPGAASSLAGDPGPRIFELSTLYEVSRTLLGSDSADHMAFDTLTAVMGLTGASWGCFLASGPEGLIPLRCCGRSELGDTVLSCPEELQRALAGSRGPLRASDLPGLPPWIRDSGADILLPLSEEKALLGLILLGPNRLESDPLSSVGGLLVSVADLIGLAWRRMQPAVEKKGAHPEEPMGLGVLRQRHPSLERIRGSSPHTLELCTHIARVAETDCTVLLEGETGTGKELAAQTLHEIGRRRDGPFVALDCGALALGTVESELFGHVRGAFTGAHRDHAGCFQQAEGGTLFLDEVGNLPPEVQRRLLRVLQERRVRPIGGELSFPVDFRLIAASAIDLTEAVRSGSFREDLYYRLYVYPIRLAPLRERRGDIRELARSFISSAAEKLGWPTPGVEEPFFRILEAHHFPGNVRELEHVVERALLNAGKGMSLTGDELAELLGGPGGGTAADGAVPPGTQRGALVLKVLRRHRFNIQAASRALESGTDPVAGSLPVSDRSTLRYYLRGEMIRAWLAEDGDLVRAVRTVAGPTGREEPVRRKMVLLLDSLQEMACRCEGSEELRRQLLERFRKLPADYMPVVEDLGDRIWQQVR